MAKTFHLQNYELVPCTLYPVYEAMCQHIKYNGSGTTHASNTAIMECTAQDSDQLFPLLKVL